MLFSSFCYRKYFLFSDFSCLRAQTKLSLILSMYYMDVVSYQ